MKPRLIPTLYILLLCAAASAEPVVEMEGTAIIGEQEQPKVRFAIPWQKLPPAADTPRPWVSQQGEATTPLDPVYFRQLLRFKALAAQSRDRAAPPRATTDGKNPSR